MKINEIVVEGIMGGLAGAAKGLARSVADVPGKVKAGYQAGAETPVQQAPGYQPGAIQPKTGAEQYMKDIGSAIKAGASGGYATSSTPTAYSKAPVGTKIGQWTKTSEGWVNTKTNVAANPTEAETLDRAWYKETQKNLRTAPANQGQKISSTDQAVWDAKKKILSINGQQYKKTAKGWLDVATDELVDPKFSGELQTAFDRASGRVPVSGPADNSSNEKVHVVGKVTTPDGIEVYKWNDGVWTIPTTKEQVVKPNDLRQLEILLKKQQPHTGGKRPGVISQTPSAIKQRQARAAKKASAEPAVFTSNRRSAK